jgi:hypothetical protein
MNTIHKEDRKEYISWKSLKALPRFREFLEQYDQVCWGCYGFEVSDEILEQTGHDNKASLFRKYKEWYIQEN